MSVDVLTVSSKGQVVLPMEMRKKLSIQTGDKMAAFSSGDIIMLKPIKIPTEDDFSARLDEARAWAAEVGYSEEDVSNIIKSTRQRKRG